MRPSIISDPELAGKKDLNNKSALRTWSIPLSHLLVESQPIKTEGQADAM